MTGSSIERRALKNTAVGGLSFLATMAQAVVLVPILLRYWGSTTYGLWLTLMAVFALLQTFDLGHQNYVGNRLNLEFHRDVDRFRRTLGSGVIVACALGLLELLFAVAVVKSNLLPSLLGASAETIARHQLAVGLVILMTMWVTFGSVGGIVVRILIPAGMLYESQWFSIMMRFAQFLAVAIVAYTGGGILAACFFYAVVQSVVSLVIFRFIKRRLPTFYPWWKGARWADGLQALRRSLVLTFISVMQQLSNSGLLVLVSLLFAAALVPLFATTRTLTNTAATLTIVFITALFPDMIRFQATAQTKKLSDVFATHWFISGAFVNLGIVLTLPVIEPIYHLWTRGQLSFHPLLFLLLATTISATNFGAALNMYLHGINDLRAQWVITITRTTVLFAVAYVLSGYGIVAVGIACLAGEVGGSLILPTLFANRQLGYLDAKLAGSQLVIASVPPCLLALGCMAYAVWEFPFGTLTLALTPALLAIYLWHWRTLSREVRTRIVNLGAALTRRGGAQPPGSSG